MNNPINITPNFDLSNIEKQLAEFENQERKRLGMELKKSQWHDPNPQNFSKQQRQQTTILFGGLTIMQDRLLEAGLASLGYRLKALECPDNNSMQLGKEFGNRGQCNPTYFTVGNLVKYLINLRDQQGLSTEDIINKYVFVTAGACGPCRFGTYVTEYRKALRDSGFAGFRVFLFKTGGGIHQSGEDDGLGFTPRFFIKMFQCIMLGDILNIVGYRIRPYEIDPGSTDQALTRCKDLITKALRDNKRIMSTLRKCRGILSEIKVDRSMAKPKVSIIGEFWAMTTEGDGNYHLQRFLEQEGAECDIQPVTNWLLYVVWATQFDAQSNYKLRMSLTDKISSHLDSSPVKTVMLTRLTAFIVNKLFNRYAKALGLNHFKLTDMNELAKFSHQYYKNELRGGEGHMEVGKLILNVNKNKSHLVISVKPFGCMPSSGVSDGVQSLIVAKYPDAHFLPIETSGDGAVNAYSRIQMALFKARKKAQKEYDTAVAMLNSSKKGKRQWQQRVSKSLQYPRHKVPGTAANLAYEALD